VHEVVKRKQGRRLPFSSSADLASRELHAEGEAEGKARDQASCPSVVRAATPRTSAAALTLRIPASRAALGLLGA